MPLREPVGRPAPLIVARDVAVTIDAMPLLLPTSFTIQAGQCVAVTGPNGAGKTTLLRVVAGLTRTFAGTLIIQGHPAQAQNPKTRELVAALIGVPPFAPHLTVVEHLTMVAASWGWKVPEARTRALDILASLNISQFAGRYPHELSSGQTQLFSLALTLSRKFDVLVLDEPEQRLDPDRLALVTALLKDLKTTGVTILAATHSPTLVAELSDWELPIFGNEHAVRS